MPKPIAVCISDVHYNIHTLPLADNAMRQAITKANELEVPLIVAGDLHDTKANLRGECVNAMIETFKLARIRPYVIIGNHDRINEKSEEHSLTFLQNHANIVNRFRHTKSHTLMYNIVLVCYHSDIVELKKFLKNQEKNQILVMHQGLNNSNSGHYIQDKNAITKEDVAGMRVISGHYHTRQDIDLPDGGKWSYLGNPYTLNFGEASDPPKGYNILMDDGSLESVPTNLRKHVVYEIDLNSAYQPAILTHKEHDLVYMKVRGTKEQLLHFKKPFNCRLDLIPTDTTTDKTIEKENKTQPQVLDDLIDSLTETSDTRKLRLKHLWKEFN